MHLDPIGFINEVRLAVVMGGFGQRLESLHID
jgi:hypothetical protein